MFYNRAGSSAGLERVPYKHEVGSSTLSLPTVLERRIEPEIEVEVVIIIL